MLTSAAALSVAMMVGASMPANALILDFADYIDNTVGEQAVTSSFAFNLGGLSITARGYNNSVDASVFPDGIVPTGETKVSGPFAYLDSGHAGIGVCQEIGLGAQCQPNSDDNVTGADPTEILSLSFSEDIQITKAFFRDTTHGTAFPVEIVGTDPAQINFSVSDNLGNTVVAVDAKTFGIDTSFGKLLNGVALATLVSGNSIDFGYNNTQFYLSGLEVFGKPGGSIPQIPLPASIYLFGTGLLGIGFLARRRRRKTKGELKFA